MLTQALKLEGSSRAGGARPKALVHDDEGEWVAKFPSTVRGGRTLEVVRADVRRRVRLVAGK